MNTIRERILNLLFPPKCPFCRKVLDTVGICPACMLKLSVQERTVLWKISGMFPCIAPLHYRGDVRNALLRLKFYSDSSVAEPLGVLLAQSVKHCLNGQFDVITWAPVSRKRLWERGYDQAQLLAQAAGRNLGMKPQRLLRKIRNNPPQSQQKSAADRIDNVRNVYVAQGKPEGLRILLIDDICTTGSTLSECIRVLQEAGAASVVCATVATGRIHHVTAGHSVHAVDTSDTLDKKHK